MAPVKESGQDGDPAYDYLKALDAREEGHEIERLLYVAATRAEHRLHLFRCHREIAVHHGKRVAAREGGPSGEPH